jgi:hypothetical protein
MMTPGEIDFILDRFDQTDRQTQRQIVVAMARRSYLLEKENAALKLVHQEARELIGEADATGVIPQANIDALRALLWRASVMGRVKGK